MAHNQVTESFLELVNTYIRALLEEEKTKGISALAQIRPGQYNDPTLVYYQLVCFILHLQNTSYDYSILSVLWLNVSHLLTPFIFF